MVDKYQYIIFLGVVQNLFITNREMHANGFNLIPYSIALKTPFEIHLSKCSQEINQIFP